MSNGHSESEYDFTLVVDGIVELNDDVLNALFEAGCDDVTFSMRSGRLFAAFSRMGLSMMQAVRNAIGDLKKANVGAAVLRIER